MSNLKIGKQAKSLFHSTQVLRSSLAGKYIEERYYGLYYLALKIKCCHHLGIFYTIKPVFQEDNPI